MLRKSKKALYKKKKNDYAETTRTVLPLLQNGCQQNGAVMANTVDRTTTK